jgi:hypothetical protein
MSKGKQGKAFICIITKILCTLGRKMLVVIVVKIEIQVEEGSVTVVMLFKFE